MPAPAVAPVASTEMPKQVTVAALRIPGKVIRSLVNVLKERGFRIDDPVRLQDAVDFRDDPARFEYMLQHGLYNHHIKAPVF